MLMRALVPRRSFRSLLAALVLAVVLTMVLSLAMPSAAHAAPPTAAPAPVEPASLEPAPVEPAPAEPAPIEPAPVEPAPVEPAPVEPAPVEPAPVEPAPVEPAPVEPAPVQPTPGEPTPVEPAPEQPAPIGPAPIGPAPIEPTPIEPAPIERAPAPEQPEEAADDLAEALAVQVACAPGEAYAVTPAGAVHRIWGPAGGLLSEQLLAPTDGWSDVDGLGVSAGDDIVYAFRSSSTGMSSLLTLASGTDAWQETPAVIGGHDRPLTAGAVSLADGRYYVGGFRSEGSRLVFRLYRVSAAGAVAEIGWFDAGAASAPVNADMAFDQAGNLYVIRGNTSATRYTVPASSLAGGTSHQLERTLLEQQQGGAQPSSTGLAFTESGYAFVSNGSHARYIDPVSWRTSGGNTNMGFDISDLAGCTTPITITLRKDVVERADADDQFLLSVQPGGEAARSTTTVGAAVGVQAQQVGPIAVVAGTRVSLSETVVAAAASDYVATWRCTNGLSGTGTSVPSIALSRGSVVCTFRNAPRDIPPQPTTVTITKIVQDANGANAQPGTGWQLDARVAGDGVSVQSASGTEVGLADASGSARWNVQYVSATASAEVTVSEVQRSGYVLEDAACTVDGEPVTVPVGESVTLPGVQPGSAVACTFVNRMLPTTLALAVIVEGGASASDWHVSATGPAEALPGPAGASGTPEASAAVTPGAAYALALSGGPTTYVPIGDWSCLDTDGGAIAVDGGAVQLALGDQVVCTATAGTAEMVLLKHIDPAFPGTLAPEDFSLTATPDDAAGLGLTATTVVGSEAASEENTFEVRPGTAYALTESSQYAALALALQRYDAAGVRWIDVTDPTAIVLEPGERAMFRFVNAAPPTLALPLTGGLGADAYLLGGTAVLLLGLLAAAALLVRTRMRSHQPGRLT